VTSDSSAAASSAVARLSLLLGGQWTLLDCAITRRRRPSGATTNARNRERTRPARHAIAHVHTALDCEATT
jgi:hypothetical protein